MQKQFIKMNKVDIGLIIIVIMLIIVNLILYVKNTIQPQEEQLKILEILDNTSRKSKNEYVSVPQTEEEVVKKLSTLGERDRMEYYCGVYFKHIQKGEYEEAYELLYDEFKQKYFPTIDEYKEYINKTYPENFALVYDDITRQGYIYVLDLNILDVLGSKENKKTQRIVVKENTYNNFVMSFQVI